MFLCILQFPFQSIRKSCQLPNASQRPPTISGRLTAPSLGQASTASCLECRASSQLVSSFGPAPLQSTPHSNQSDVKISKQTTSHDFLPKNLHWLCLFMRRRWTSLPAACKALCDPAAACLAISLFIRLQLHCFLPVP